MPPEPRLLCAITGRPFNRRDLIQIDHLRPPLAERLLQKHPHLTPEALVSSGEVAKVRMAYVADLLMAEHGELNELEQQVAASIAAHDTIAANVEQTWERKRTLGNGCRTGSPPSAAAGRS